MSVNPGIFKAYDIRGIYPAELDEDDGAAQIGRAFVAYLGAKRIAVGRDMRVSAPSHRRRLHRGRARAGRRRRRLRHDRHRHAVLRRGPRRPRRRRADHRVAQPEASTTAMKLVRAEAVPAERRGRHLARSATWSSAGTHPAAGGRARARSPRTPTCSTTTSTHVLTFIDPSIIKPFNVVLDAGSGMAGLVAPKLFDRLPCRTTRLCFEIDGTFPNHEANPLIEENRRDIVERVDRRAGRHRHRVGRRRRPLLLHRRRRRVHPGRLHHGAARRGVPAEGRRAPTIIYDLRASYAVKDTVAQLRRHGADEPRRPRVLQEADARGERGLRRRGDRATTTSATTSTPTTGSSRRC